MSFWLSPNNPWPVCICPVFSYTLNVLLMNMFVSQVGFRKGGIQLCGGLGRRTQLEIVLAALLVASLLSLFACAVTLGVHYKNGNPTMCTPFLASVFMCVSVYAAGWVCGWGWRYWQCFGSLVVVCVIVWTGWCLNADHFKEGCSFISVNATHR